MLPGFDQSEAQHYPLDNQLSTLTYISSKRREYQAGVTMP